MTIEIHQPELEQLIHERLASGRFHRDGERQLAGQPLIADGLIATTALEHGLTLVTRNIKDFSRLGVLLFNPWNRETF